MAGKSMGAHSEGSYEIQSKSGETLATTAVKRLRHTRDKQYVIDAGRGPSIKKQARRAPYLIALAAARFADNHRALSPL
jgi:hypothetical protein